MRKNEIRKLKTKTREWDKEVQEVNRYLRKRWRCTRKYMNSIFDWLFFYKPEDTSDKIYHLIQVFFAYIIILRLFDLI